MPPKVDEKNRTRNSRGHLYAIDKIPWGSPEAGPALTTYANSINANRQSRHWVRAVQWMENVLFGLGRQYIDDILVSRLSRDTNGDLQVTQDFSRNIPRPTNDILGRYIETNIALLNENQPKPRITAKSDSRTDRNAAELSELTMEYLWEKLRMPELHREIARLLLYTGVCWMEVLWDETAPRHMTVPQTEEEQTTPVPGPGGLVQAPVERQVPVIDEQGRPVLTGAVEYGDIQARVCSAFEMHIPVSHWWNGDDMGWIMREYYVPVDVLRDKYLDPKLKGKITKKNGWFKDQLDSIKPVNVRNLPLWWWERLSDVVEGPGPTLYVGTPEQWDDYTVVRVFDRKPNPTWPKGRTVIVAGENVIYDSPKNVGARAYDPRWPDRWHPYVRYRWEGQVGSIYGRSLVSKLLPKLKRVNAIDTTLIMWRRTVPIATWIMPKGTSPVEDLHSGRPGSYIVYDPRRTNNAEPKPVFPPDYPAAALDERSTQIAEMEAIAGTEEILRGQRPQGVNSATMLDTLRRQALASRSAILQAWDESLQECGTALLQETIKRVAEDTRYAERIRILAREKKSQFSISSFSGTDLSDNVVVRVDTASMAMVSREARQARALEVMQYAQGLMMLPPTLRTKLVADLGWPDSLVPQGSDIDRAKLLISYIKAGNIELAIPMAEDDPYVIHEFLVNEMKSESFVDLPDEQQVAITNLADVYQQQIEMIEAERLKMQEMLAARAQVNEAPGGPEGVPDDGSV